MEYRRPSELDEALSLLDEHGFDAKVLAGGQSLIPMMSAGFAAPEILVDINDLADLDRVLVTGDDVRIGALVRHRTLELASAELAAAAPLLPAAAPFISHAAIRNRGTFVGSLVHADPSAEWPAIAVALDAEVHLTSAGGGRVVPASEFILGPLTSDIGPEELAVEVRFPVAAPGTGVSVQELAYRDGDYAVVGVGAQMSLNDHDVLVNARLVLFSVDATPVRAVEAEQLLEASGPDAIDEAAALARAAANPTSDATASAEYRSDTIPVLCRRALREALGRARGQRGGHFGRTSIK